MNFTMAIIIDGSYQTLHYSMRMEFKSSLFSLNTYNMTPGISRLKQPFLFLEGPWCIIYPWVNFFPILEHFLNYLLPVWFGEFSINVKILSHFQYNTINESQLGHCPMDQYEMAYAQALIDYNTALLNGDPTPNLVDKFAAAVAPFHDSVSNTYSSFG